VGCGCRFPVSDTGVITERHHAGAADSGQGSGKNQSVGRLQPRGATCSGTRRGTRKQKKRRVSFL